MDGKWIRVTLDTLQQAGIAAQRGYPSGVLPCLTEPVAMVSVQKAVADETTISVQIYVPVSQGGNACEDLALTAAQTLQEIGAVCQVGSCSFSSKGGFFNLPVQAMFSEKLVAESVADIPQPKVEINGVTVSGVLDVATAFNSTSVKGKNTTTGEIGMVAAEKRWTVTVEDLISSEVSPLESITDGFTVVITRDTQKETYTGCCWDKATSQITANGIRRVRVAITCNDPVVADV